jgi:hypothetical protein
MPALRSPADSTERGQVVPLMLVVLVLAAVAGVVVAQVAAASIERGHAQMAADAAALAGAAEGRPTAEALAEANGAELSGYVERGVAVEVDVRFRRASARATAEAVTTTPAPGGGDRHGLAPAVAAALARADALLGRSVPVVSGYRSPAEQEALWQRRHQNPYPVAPPGTSLHEVGLAVDVPTTFVSTLLTVATQAGLCQPLPETDPIHFEPCPQTRPE